MDSNWTQVDGVWTSGDLAYRVTGLAEGWQYAAQVRAVYDAGHGSWSASAKDRDLDDDGLIEINNLAQLNAVRWDLDGDGVIEETGQVDESSRGCRMATGCMGYELAANLDFDTDGDGAVDSDDDYWNDGAGWEPIGNQFPVYNFNAAFEGNGHTISNLFINRKDTEFLYVGLFGYIGLRGEVRNLGLPSVDVTNAYGVGGLAGANTGDITSVYVTGSVTSTGRLVEKAGGLSGYSGGWIVASYFNGNVTAVNTAGGLVGATDNQIIASYASGTVTAEQIAGGLTGVNFGVITASYATGSVEGDYDAGGLTGITFGTAADSYWDTDSSGQSDSAGGTGKTTGELQTPNGYTGIYADWNADLDADGNADDPWDFGTCIQYPVIKTDFNGDGKTTWQEFGDQRPPPVNLPVSTTVPAASAGLVSTLGRDRVTLSWNHPCDNTISRYQYRQSSDGGAAWSPDWTDIPGSDGKTTSYDVSGLTIGETYRFQVRATNAAGNGPAVDSGLVHVAALRVYMERLDGGRYYPAWVSWRPLPTGVNTREHSWDAVVPHIYNVTREDAHLKSATLTLITGTGMADVSDFSNLGSSNTFDWFVVPISAGLPIEPLPDGVVPTVEESPSGPKNGQWFHPEWRVADDRTLEGDELVQVRFDYTLNDGSVGTYLTEPFTLEDDDTATVSVRDATAEESDGSVDVEVRLTVIDDATAGPGLGASGGDGPGNSPQRLLFPVTVDYATSDGTATAGADYTPISGTLTFDGTDLAKTVSIPLINDDTDEDDETFTVTISNLAKDTSVQSLLDARVFNDYDVGTVTITEATLVDHSTSVSISADGNPLPGNRVTMTAGITNPQNGTPTYRWQRRFSDGWRDTPETGSTKSVRFDTAGTRTYRVIITYQEGRDIVSEPFSLTWGDPRG